MVGERSDLALQDRVAPRGKGQRMTKPRGRVAELRERVYGGKAGIWLKKRKNRVFPNAAADDLPSQERHDKKVRAEEASVSNGDKTSEFGMPGNSSAVIGWDDVRCRPIYNDSNQPTITPSVELDDEHAEDVGGVIRNEISDEEALDACPDLASFNASSDSIGGSKKTRAYGSQKRRSILSDVVTRKRAHVSKDVDKSIIASIPIATPSTNPTPYDLLETPQTVMGSVCVALNTETKATPLRRSVSDHEAPSQSLQHKNPTEEQKSKKPPFRKKKSASARSSASATADSKPADLDFVDENVGQPSSATSLDAAKAFFERLDSEQKLTLDASETPLAKGKRCVRTRRAIHVQSDNLLQEYEEYVTATKASGVNPLSVEQYAVNRSSFFRTWDMYDGFLDE